LAGNLGETCSRCPSLKINGQYAVVIRERREGAQCGGNGSGCSCDLAGASGSLGCNKVTDKGITIMYICTVCMYSKYPSIVPVITMMSVEEEKVDGEPPTRLIFPFFQGLKRSQLFRRMERMNHFAHYSELNMERSVSRWVSHSHSQFSTPPY